MTPNREMFWQIENAWLFYVLAALAAGLFLAGVAAIIRVWKKSARSLEIPFSREALKRTVLDTFFRPAGASGRYKGIALSFSKILQSAGVHFGILGKKEPCCGDIARRAGELGLCAASCWRMPARRRG